MSTTTLTDLLTAQVTTAWGYVSAVIGTIWPFVLGVSILIGAIYLIIRVSRGSR